MRAMTWGTWYTRCAIWAAMMFLLSPFVTAANASASRMPALFRRSSSTPSPTIILLERPFKHGDWITVSASVNPAYGVSGSVQSVTLRTTTVRMADGELASIPNFTVFSNLVVNATALDRRQQTFTVRVHETDAVRPMVEHIRTTLPTVRGVEKSPAPIIRPEPHTDGGFLIKYSYWVNRKRNDLDAVATAVANALWVDITPTSLPKDEA